MTELADLTIADIRDGVRDGAFKAREVAEAFNARVAEASALNAFLVATPDHALAPPMPPTRRARRARRRSRWPVCRSA